MQLDEATAVYYKLELIILECLQYFVWGPEKDSATLIGVKSGRKGNG